jgi:hypothetical protein
MTYKTIPTLFLILIRRRRRNHFVPLHSPDSAYSPYSPDSLIFFSPESEPVRRSWEFTLREVKKPFSGNPNH